MTCRGICNQYKVKKPKLGGHYQIGHKRCQTCELFMKWDGNADDPKGTWCPCCGYRLRLNPRNSVQKEALRASKEKSDGK